MDTRGVAITRARGARRRVIASVAGRAGRVGALASSCRGRVFRASTGGGATLLSLLCLPQPVAVSLDGDELCAMEQAVDEGHDACGVGEDRGPLGKGLVGGEHDRFVLLVPAG